MKFPFSPRHLVLFLGLSTFIACKKDDAPKPDPVIPDTPEQVLFGKIQGKWNAEIEAPRRIKEGGAPVSLKSQEAYPEVTSVEFFDDSTFILGTYSYYHSTIGKFSIKDSASIQLSDVALVKNIKFSADQISFDVTIGDYTFSTIANKVAPLQIADTKKGLLKNWTLELGEDYDGYFKYNLQDFEANKIKRLFTAHGTVYTQFYDGNELKGGIVNSWRWHPTQTDAIVEYRFYEDYEEVSEYRYQKINSLGDNILSVTEYAVEANGPYEVESFEYFINPPAAPRKK